MRTLWITCRGLVDILYELRASFDIVGCVLYHIRLHDTGMRVFSASLDLSVTRLEQTSSVSMDSYSTYVGNEDAMITIEGSAKVER